MGEVHVALYRSVEVVFCVDYVVAEWNRDKNTDVPMSTSTSTVQPDIHENSTT